MDAYKEWEHWQARAEELEEENEDLIERIAALQNEAEAQRRLLTGRLADLIASMQ